MCKSTDKLRLEVFNHYCDGTVRCQCPGCPVTYIGFLEMDHVNGDGAAHRKANNLGTGGARLWRELRRQGYPEGFQVLCSNCNSSKGTKSACDLAGHDHSLPAIPPREILAAQ
jgi:hypothetical protein